MMALEETYFSMAEKCSQNVLIIADRGVMDASAFISRLVLYTFILIWEKHIFYILEPLNRARQPRVSRV